jgi:Transglycosylase SLT domain/Domain of unknown function (DUF4124)
MYHRLALLTMLMLSSAAAEAAIKIYSYVDSDGQRHYTDIPDNSRYRLLHLSPHDLTESGQYYDPSLLARSSQYDPIIERAAASASVESNLLRAVIVVESGFNSHALSKRGAVGLMQLMPATRGSPISEIPDRTLRPRYSPRARGLQRRRAGRGPQRRDTAVFGDPGLRTEGTENLSLPRGSAAHDLTAPAGTALPRTVTCVTASRCDLT